MARVSVIIPCYNQGHFLDEAVDSVLAQTFADFEIIVVNDGSTDSATNELLSGYDRPKTRVLTTENCGLAQARNNGINEASGEYILPLDADDKIGPGYLEEAVSLLDGDPLVGIVYCRAQLFGAVETEWHLPDFSEAEMMYDNVIFCSALFRRSDWADVGGYSGEMVYGWEDYDFWLSLLERGRLVRRIDEILFFYRVASDSMVRSKERWQKVEMFKRIFRRHKDFYADNIEHWIEIVLDARENYHQARLYVDCGDGISNENSIVRKVDRNSTRLDFDLSHYTGIKAVRFDPMECSCVVHVDSIELNLEDGGTVTPADWLSNALYEEGGHYYFSGKDPWLYPIFSEQDLVAAKELILQFRFEAIEDRAMAEIIALQQQRLEQLGSTGEKRRYNRQDVVATSIMPRHSWRSLLNRLKLCVKNRGCLKLELSGLFDPFYYTAHYTDVRENPDVRDGQMTPLSHYINFGAREGRRPNAFFDPDYYLEQVNETLEPADLLLHYLNVGSRQGLKPSPRFDPAYYEERYTKKRKMFGLQPALGHYLRHGLGRFYPREGIEDLPIKPTISVLVPVYNVSPNYLNFCICSVIFQSYPHLELCLVDDCSTSNHIRPFLKEWSARDPRIKLKFLDENSGISGATNAAAELATGDYLCFLDNDDKLSPDCLQEVVKTINEQGADLLYSDEDLINQEGVRTNIFAKPAYNRELLLSHNYVTHLMVVKQELFKRAGGLDPDVSGAQDYDLMLKLAEQAEKIVHIPKVLYHWRAIETSTSIDHSQKDYADEAGRRALRNTMKRQNINAQVLGTDWKYFYRYQRVVGPEATVTLCVTRHDGRPLLPWLNELLISGDHPVLQVLVTGGVQSADSQGELSQDGRIVPLRFFDSANRESGAADLNRAVREAAGDYLLFVSDGVIGLKPGWLSALLEFGQDPENGMVGGRLVATVKEMQNGVVPDLENNSPDYYLRFFCESSTHLNGRHSCQNVQALTGDLCLIRRELFLSCKGLDEENFNDLFWCADLCLRLGDEGLRNVYTPFCRGERGVSVVDRTNCDAEKERFCKRWQDILAKGDPNYHTGPLEKSGIALKDFHHWYRGSSQ
ncbi:MAG: glycosyltransferase [Thermodesulfobacteriota bacterium]